jgi:hypothetical protein
MAQSYLRDDINASAKNCWESIQSRRLLKSTNTGKDGMGGTFQGGLALPCKSLNKPGWKVGNKNSPPTINQLGIDCIDNNRPHFPGTRLSNVDFVPACLNGAARLLAKYGNGTANEIKRRMKLETPSEAIWKAEFNLVMKAGGAGSREQGQLKVAMRRVWRTAQEEKDANKPSRNHAGSKEFTSMADTQKYLTKLVERQKMCCKISGIFCDGGTDDAGTRNFALGFDAINPLLGHIKGNIQVVCCCFNIPDHSRSGHKNKPFDDCLFSSRMKKLTTLKLKKWCRFDED